MLTVSALARRCGLTRSTVLYYESKGLLPRPARTEGNYRTYTASDVRRLEQICVYRKVGLSLADVRSVLNQAKANAAQVLENRLAGIDAEIERLRGHQRAILRLLQQSRTIGGRKMITKEKWVAIMQAAGFSEDDMHRWHREFEKDAPAEHQRRQQRRSHDVERSETRSVHGAGRTVSSGGDRGQGRATASPRHADGVTARADRGPEERQGLCHGHPLRRRVARPTYRTKSSRPAGREVASAGRRSRRAGKPRWD